MLPIPPGTHWQDVMPVVLPTAATDQPLELPAPDSKPVRKPKPKVQEKRGPAALSGVSFAPPPSPVREKPKPAGGAKKPKRKNDPKHVAAARELRDRWLEQVNGGAFRLESRGRYEVARALPADGPAPAPTLLLPAA